MDGENKGKPYEQMDDFGVFPSFWKHSNSQIPAWVLLRNNFQILDVLSLWATTQ